MIKAADLILRNPAFKKPTVIMLVDRNELESQLFANVAAYGLSPEIARSKQHLRELLRSDYHGLIVSMIHKFDKADADMCTRSNVFLLVDEAHRTTSGDLGNYLVAAIPNATMLGFTGTPIDKIAYGKGTFKVFGKDDEKGYLDKYSIAESIEDGTTLPLNYTLAPNDIRVPREQLEKEFLDLADAQGISDIEELNKILDRAVNLKTFLKADDRVDKVARFVSQHFRENVEPLGYKAFLVGVDREACALYKNALDKYLPSEYSAVVYTSAHNDSQLLAEFKLNENEEKLIRRAFIKRGNQPKILIVTEKLLTGFDAPILYCMYLDKADARPHPATGDRAREPALRRRRWHQEARRLRPRFRRHLRKAGEGPGVRFRHCWKCHSEYRCPEASVRDIDGRTGTAVLGALFGSDR
jgi:type I restriction enzyme, R subunit